MLFSSFKPAEGTIRFVKVTYVNLSVNWKALCAVLRSIVPYTSHPGTSLKLKEQCIQEWSLFVGFKLEEGNSRQMKVEVPTQEDFFYPVL